MSSADNQRWLRLRAGQEIEKLLNYCTLRRLEALLGLSHGYLSRLRASAHAATLRLPSPATPSQSLVCALALLAMDPQKRLQELEELIKQAPTIQ